MHRITFLAVVCDSFSVIERRTQFGKVLNVKYSAVKQLSLCFKGRIFDLKFITRISHSNDEKKGLLESVISF
jgi:hypothetical protein